MADTKENVVLRIPFIFQNLDTIGKNKLSIQGTFKSYAKI